MKLSTTRLVLEPIQPEDEPALLAHWTELEVRRFLWDGRRVTSEEVRSIITTSESLFREQQVGLWAIRRSTAAMLIGCGGYWYFHDPPELELVLSLSRASWGLGFGQEAARALVGYAFERLRWSTVQASSDEPNQASLRLMRRLGMSYAGERRGAVGPVLVYRLSPGDGAVVGARMTTLRPTLRATARPRMPPSAACRSPKPGAAPGGARHGALPGAGPRAQRDA